MIVGASFGSCIIFWDKYAWDKYATFFMHKKSPTGGEDTLYIPFKFYRKVPCVSNKKTLLSWYNERNI